MTSKGEWNGKFQDGVGCMRNPSRQRPDVVPMRARGGPEPEHSIIVKDRHRLHAIRVDELDYVEAQGDYVALHSAGRRFLKHQPISSFENALDSARFIRVHRSRIVNLDRIVRISPSAKDCAVTLADGTRLGMSRSGRARLLEAMDRTTAAREPDSGPPLASGGASAAAD